MREAQGIVGQGGKVDFSKDTIELMNKSPQNFERLVLICMDSYDSESRIFWFSLFRPF